MRAWLDQQQQGTFEGSRWDANMLVRILDEDVNHGGDLLLGNKDPSAAPSHRLQHQANLLVSDTLSSVLDHLLQGSHSECR